MQPQRDIGKDLPKLAGKFRLAIVRGSDGEQKVNGFAEALMPPLVTNRVSRLALCYCADRFLSHLFWRSHAASAPKVAL